jgi:MFS transporter, OFA family, oxalate/formate antiporter
MNFQRHPRKALMALAGSSLTIFWPGALIFGFPGVMGPYWQRTFHAGKGTIGNTLFFVLAALGILMFFVGRWQERFGTRKMITFGSAVCSLNVLLIAYASNVTMLYLWAFITGAASCFIYIPGVTCVQRWYPERKGLVSGIFNLTFGISAAIMSPLFRWALDSMGYFFMNLVVAVLALTTGLVAAQFSESPERVLSGRDSSSPRGADPPFEKIPSLTVRESLGTKSFWFLWLTWAFEGAAGIAMVTLSTAFGLSRGFRIGSAVILLTAFNITNGLGRIIMGYLSDKIARGLAMSLTFLASGLAYLLLPHFRELPVLAFLAAVVGFGFGTLFAVSAPLAADCFGLRHFGAILGLVFTAYGFVSGILGPSLSGYLLDLTGGNFVIVFSYLGFFSILAAFFIRFVIPPRQGR